MLRSFLLTLTLALSIALPATGAESPLAQYRGVTLGDSVQSVVDRLQLVASDVKVTHERPTVVQEVTWRQHRFISGSSVAPDTLAEMVLTFYDGRLARITVLYDRERTQGLTDIDLREAMGLVYGPSILIATPTPGTLGHAYARHTIGHWEDADSRLLLWREQYPTRLGLTISAIAADRDLQQVIATAESLRAAEAPARELARRSAEAAAVQAKDEKTRRENKAGFKP